MGSSTLTNTNGPTPENFEAAPQGGFIDAIVEIAGTGKGEAPQTLGHVIDALDDRAFGLLILILTIPCLVPGLPGAQIIAIPIFLLGLQIVFGRNEPWLPGWAMRAKLKPEWLSSIAEFANKRLRWTERLSRPRWRFIAHGAGERILGLIIALAAITIMLPITNTIPSLAITVAAVGLLQRDGMFMSAGAALALAWITALGILVFGLITGAGFAATLVAEHAPWLAEWFR
jgi:hypothetical protein